MCKEEKLTFLSDNEAEDEIGTEEGTRQPPNMYYYCYVFRKL